MRQIRTLLLKKLTKNDIINGHKWENTLIIVTANNARNAINLIKLQLVPKHNNRYIYRWKITLTTSGERLIATDIVIIFFLDNLVLIMVTTAYRNVDC